MDKKSNLYLCKNNNDSLTGFCKPKVNEKACLSYIRISQDSSIHEHIYLRLHILKRIRKRSLIYLSISLDTTRRLDTILM